MGTAIWIQASTGDGAAVTIVDAAYLAGLDRARDPAVVTFARSRSGSKLAVRERSLREHPRS